MNKVVIWLECLILEENGLILRLGILGKYIIQLGAVFIPSIFSAVFML